jgi:hypothetical protein
MADRFGEYRGRWIEIAGSSNVFYVPKDDEDHLKWVAVSMAFAKQEKDGWQVVAISGTTLNDDDEEEEWQYDGLLAIKPATGEVLECEGGFNKVLKAPLDTIEIKVITDD